MKSSPQKKTKSSPFFFISGIAIFSAFMVLMVVVTVTVYSRTSGRMGLDMGKVQKMRYDLSS